MTQKLTGYSCALKDQILWNISTMDGEWKASIHGKHSDQGF